MKIFIKWIVIILGACVFYVLGYNTDRSEDRFYQIMKTPVFANFIKSANSTTEYVDEIYLNEDEGFIEIERRLVSGKILRTQYYDDGQCRLMYIAKTPTSYWLEIDFKEEETFRAIFFNGASKQQLMILDEHLEKAFKKKLPLTYQAKEIDF